MTLVDWILIGAVCALVVYLAFARNSVHELRDQISDLTKLVVNRKPEPASLHASDVEDLIKKYLPQATSSSTPAKGPKPRTNAFSAKRAFAVTVGSSAGLGALDAVLEEIREAAKQGRVSCNPKSLTEHQRVILFHLGYGGSSDGSVHWSGLDTFAPDPIPSSTSGDYNLEEYIKLTKSALETLT
jgi:hypothetical protein